MSYHEVLALLDIKKKMLEMKSKKGFSSEPWMCSKTFLTAFLVMIYFVDSWWHHFGLLGFIFIGWYFRNLCLRYEK